MKLNINKKIVATLLAGSISLSGIGCINTAGSDTDYNNQVDETIEFILDSDAALNNIQNDYKEVLDITDIYFDARDLGDLDKVKEFYDNIREIYLNYDLSKARKALALLPYLIEAEVFFRNTGYTLSEEEMKVVNEIYPVEHLINGYTIPEFAELYNIPLEEEKEDTIIFDFETRKSL